MKRLMTRLGADVLKVQLIAFDSMGVRGMATFIETSEGAIFVDPGAALAPKRYGLPPHRLEIEVLEEKLNQVYRRVEEADVIVITHYHRDHYLYRRGEESYYAGKILFIKHPTFKINPSQRVRAHILLKKMGVERVAKSIVFSDGQSFSYGKVRIGFSIPVYHGNCGSRLGWVLAVSVEDEYRLVHASDVQGFACRESLDIVIGKPWDFLIVSGPPTYLERDPHPQRALSNLIEALRAAREGSRIVVDHHLLRDKNYEFYVRYLESVSGVKVMTAAEFMGQEVRQLEAHRDALWGSRIPSRS